MLCRPIVCTIKGHGCLYQRGLALVFMPTRIARSYTQLSTGSEAGNPAWPGHPGRRFQADARSRAQFSTGSEAVTYSMSRAQGLFQTREIDMGFSTFRNTIGFISDPRNRHGISNVQKHDQVYF